MIEADPVAALLNALLAAWRADIDSEPAPAMPVLQAMLERRMAQE